VCQSCRTRRKVLPYRYQSLAHACSVSIPTVILHQLYVYMIVYFGHTQNRVSHNPMVLFEYIRFVTGRADDRNDSSNSWVFEDEWYSLIRDNFVQLLTIVALGYIIYYAYVAFKGGFDPSRSCQKCIKCIHLRFTYR